MQDFKKIQSLTVQQKVIIPKIQLGIQKQENNCINQFTQTQFSARTNTIFEKNQNFEESDRSRLKKSRKLVQWKSLDLGQIISKNLFHFEQEQQKQKNIKDKQQKIEIKAGEKLKTYSSFQEYLSDKECEYLQKKINSESRINTCRTTKQSQQFCKTDFSDIWKQKFCFSKSKLFSSANRFNWSSQKKNSLTELISNNQSEYEEAQTNQKHVINYLYFNINSTAEDKQKKQNVIQNEKFKDNPLIQKTQSAVQKSEKQQKLSIKQDQGKQIQQISLDKQQQQQENKVEDIKKSLFLRLILKRQQEMNEIQLDDIFPQNENQNNHKKAQKEEQIIFDPQSFINNFKFDPLNQKANFNQNNQQDDNLINNLEQLDNEERDSSQEEEDQKNNKFKALQFNCVLSEEDDDSQAPKKRVAYQQQKEITSLQKLGTIKIQKRKSNFDQSSIQNFRKSRTSVGIIQASKLKSTLKSLRQSVSNFQKAPITKKQQQVNFIKQESQLKDYIEVFENNFINQFYNNTNLQQEAMKNKLNPTQYINFFFQYILFSINQDNQIKESYFLQMNFSQSLFVKFIKQLQIELTNFNFMGESIEKINDKLLKHSQLILEGKVIDEIGGGNGIYQISLDIAKSLKKFSTNQNLQACNELQLINLMLELLVKVFSEIDDLLPEELINQQVALELNYEDFFLLKFFVWKILINKKCQVLTIYKAIRQLEKYRYQIAVQKSQLQLYQNLDFKEKIELYFDKLLLQDKEIYQALKNDTEVRIALCRLLIKNIVLRQPDIYDLDLFFQTLKIKSKSIMIKLSHYLKQTLQYYDFNPQFINDAVLKIKKLSYRIGLQESILSMLGGSEKIDTIISKTGEIAQKNKRVKLFTLMHFEEKNHFKYDQEENTEIQITYGLEFMKYFLFCYYSEYDCYGTSDFRAGMQVFQISLDVPLLWKMLLDQALMELQYDFSIIKQCTDQLQQEIVSLYNKEEMIIFNQFFQHQ